MISMKRDLVTGRVSAQSGGDVSLLGLRAVAGVDVDELSRRAGDTGTIALPLYIYMYIVFGDGVYEGA